MEQWKDDDIAMKYTRAENATGPFADIMVREAGLGNLRDGEKISALDIATGTGAVVAALHDAVGKEKWDQVNVVAGDVSEGMLAYLQKRGAREGWKNVDVRKIDGANIGTQESFTHIFINFAIFVLPPNTLQTCTSLLQANGFLAVSTWAYFPWYPLLSRAVAALPSPPPMPSYSAVAQRIYNTIPWDEAYVRSVLEKEGMRDVQIVQEKKRVDCGTPAQFVETMSLPLQMVAGAWEEGERAALVKEVGDSVRRIASEEAGGEGETVWMEFEGIVGFGWKA
ncbi:S-adenosyl-L-methionine-dependent methyltransferase [Lentithecium fluviatile CBS 122367]|uniref:S-adenosyl-L-methionine-dependent methyltransferase n=1 Tax=Lentithecium fluviatile CBS 122367 TaxID=1168545 RepID=A0A6G1IH93_9PLEO|nr:S-adenosyl-L-methionine-dependent methyltransferase [Lentithecium fluviatile CBS 122367]